MSVSVRLPADIARRIARVVSATDASAHAFMVEAIREKLEAAEAQAAFVAEARRGLEKMKKSGKGIPANEVFASLHSRARGEKVARPKARKVP